MSRLLLDANMPIGLRSVLDQHEVVTAFEVGWGTQSRGRIARALSSIAYGTAIRVTSGEERTTMPPDNGFELAIPPGLAAQIQAAAEAEHRPALDVLRDAVERYLAARDRREVFRIEDLPEADIAAILEGGMDPKYDYLNTELD